MSLILSYPVAARLIYIATRELINLDWRTRDGGSFFRVGYVSDKMSRAPFGLQFCRVKRRVSRKF